MLQLVHLQNLCNLDIGVQPQQTTHLPLTTVAQELWSSSTESSLRANSLYATWNSDGQRIFCGLKDNQQGEFVFDSLVLGRLKTLSKRFE